VLLRRPLAIEECGRRRELVNDKDGYVANFWRAIKSGPLELDRLGLVLW
jgi:hypothetical protein